MLLKFQLKRTLFGGPYEALTQMQMGCDTYVYVSNWTQLHMGGLYTLDLIIGCIHLCAVVRGTCPYVLVRKCVADREIWSIFNMSHTHTHNHTHNDAITYINASK